MLIPLKGHYTSLSFISHQQQTHPLISEGFGCVHIFLSRYSYLAKFVIRALFAQAAVELLSRQHQNQYKCSHHLLENPGLWTA